MSRVVPGVSGEVCEQVRPVALGRWLWTSWLRLPGAPCLSGRALARFEWGVSQDRVQQGRDEQPLLAASWTVSNEGCHRPGLSLTALGQRVRWVMVPRSPDRGLCDTEW